MSPPVFDTLHRSRRACIERLSNDAMQLLPCCSYAYRRTLNTGAHAKRHNRARKLQEGEGSLLFMDGFECSYLEARATCFYLWNRYRYSWTVSEGR